MCEGLKYPLWASLEEEPFVGELEYPGERESRLQDILEKLRRDMVYPNFQYLFAGWPIEIKEQRTFASLEGRTLVEKPPSDDTDLGPKEYLQQLFYSLLRHRPFPFGRCQVCHKVFVQSRRGRIQKYCSAVCSAKGVPAAAKRTDYTNTYRRIKRERELAAARRVLKTLPEVTLERLGEEFPKKSRRQLKALVKRVQRSQEPKQSN
jgi:hypothetical protein